MNAFIELASNYLRHRDYRIAVENDTIKFAAMGTNGTWQTTVDANEYGTILTFVSMLPLFVAPEHRTAFARHVARLNYGNRMGSWHFDMDNGMALFCVSVPTAGFPENVKAIMEFVLDLSNGSMDAMLNRVAGKAFGDFDTGANTMLKSEARIDLN